MYTAGRVYLGYIEIFHHLSSPYILSNHLKPDSTKISISSVSCSLLSNSEEKIIILKRIAFSRKLELIISFGRKEGFNISFAFNC